jgi:hypothetical protein
MLGGIPLPLVINAAVTAGPLLVPPVFAYRHAPEGPSVELWTNRGHEAVLLRGDRVRVFFRTAEDAYVTVLRIDTDGRVRMLFPDAPWEDNFARGRRSYEIDRRYADYAFVVDDYPGEGYIFAVATPDPFDYAPIARGDHWDYRAIAADGRIAGDPYTVLQELVELIVPANYESYGYDVSSYYVERRYDYPRFLCYGCHAYAAYPSWDPYRYSCVRFRIVIHDDPYYYPARAYAGTRVVYRSAPQAAPRFVFKDRAPSDPYVVRVRERGAEPAARRPDDHAVRGSDMGGAGTIPTPLRMREPRDAAQEPVPSPGTRLEVPRQLEWGAERRTITPARPRLEPREPVRPEPQARPEQRAPASQPARAQPRTPEREPSRQPAKQPEKKPAEKKPPDKPKEPVRRPG